jgi:hypothetical protein
MNQRYGPPELVAALPVAFVQKHRRSSPIAGDIPAYRLPALGSHILNYDEYNVKDVTSVTKSSLLNPGSQIPDPHSIILRA